MKNLKYCTPQSNLADGIQKLSAEKIQFRYFPPGIRLLQASLFIMIQRIHPAAVRENVRGMNAPITNNATIIPTGFSSGIVGNSTSLVSK